MRYIPIHKKTGTRYPAITEAEKAEDWSRPPYRDAFTFEEMPEEKPTKEATAPKPIGKEIETPKTENKLD